MVGAADMEMVIELRAIKVVVHLLVVLKVGWLLGALL
jgi:hypothetical protein